MKGLESKLLPGLIAAVALYLGYATLVGGLPLLDALRAFDLRALAVALLLVAVNYLLRFVRWQRYLTALDLRLPLDRSLTGFLAGFAMTVTPGKLGELLKAYLFGRSDGLPAASVGAIVIAERLTDVLGLVVVVAFGLGQFYDPLAAVVGQGAVNLLIAVCLASVAFVPLLAQPRWSAPLFAALERLPRLGALVPLMRETQAGMAALLRPRVMAVAMLLAIVGWGLEGVALWTLLHGFGHQAPPFGPALFVYGSTTLLGAVSFLPGGLGVTELALGLMLTRLGLASGAAEAAAITYLIRFATLWFGVAVGLVALARFRRRYLPAVEAAT